MTTIRPRASSSWTRNGRTSMMRASTWRSLVMMPDWLPVKLIASPPSSRTAIESSAIEMRSPAVRSMSSSRRSGLADTCLASAIRSSVVSPIADTTTTTSWPFCRVRTTRSATWRMRETSATLDPPYFWTMIDIASKCHESTKTRNQFVFFRAFVFSWLRIKYRNHGRVVARAYVLLHRARRRPRGERRAREHVVEPPADVPLPHVAPWRPPREQRVVVGIERAPEVHKAPRQDALDERALFRKLADRA